MNVTLQRHDITLIATMATYKYTYSPCNKTAPPVSTLHAVHNQKHFSGTPHIQLFAYL
jgi:hypothetical protein